MLPADGGGGEREGVSRRGWEGLADGWMGEGGVSRRAPAAAAAEEEEEEKGMSLRSGERE